MNPSPEGDTLIVTCPVCDEELELELEDTEQLELGDVLVCENCEAELEVTGTDPFEFELLAPMIDCPNCGAEVELTDEMIEAQGDVTCPNCGQVLEIEFEDDEPEGERPQA